MGLALYPSADGDSSPSSPGFLQTPGDDLFTSTSTSTSIHDHNAYLADLVAYSRHIPASRRKVRDWRCGRRKIRLTTQGPASGVSLYGFDAGMCMCKESRTTLAWQADLWRFTTRERQARILLKSSRASSGRRTTYVRGQRRSMREAWFSHTGGDVECVGMEMAALRPRRPPSLERQGAFRAASTAKRRRTMPQMLRSFPQSSSSLSLSLSLSLFPVPSRPEDDAKDTEDTDVADVTDMDRLGILYDNEHEHERGAGWPRRHCARCTAVHSVNNNHVTAWSGTQKGGTRWGRCCHG